MASLDNIPPRSGDDRILDLLFVSSAGGHLAQLTSLDTWWKQHDRRWVTFPIPDAVAVLDGESVTFAHHPTTRNARNAIRNLFLAWTVLTTRRPDVIVSTGAGVAVPFFLLGMLLRIPRVYIEVYDRIDTPTLTGRLCRPLSSEFCVQWEEQLEVYPGATLVGPLL